MSSSRVRVAVAVVVVAAVALLVGGVALAVSWGDDPSAPGAPDGIDGVQTYTDLGREHVPDPVYTDPLPPVGGDHLPYWQDCGFYDAPVEDGAGVHSLEHGAVWITYAPDLAEDQVEQLQGLAADNPYLLVSPRDDLPSPVVASAWGAQLRLDSVDDDRLPEFLAEYLQGEQTPEPGAPCTGGAAGMP